MSDISGSTAASLEGAVLLSSVSITGLPDTIRIDLVIDDSMLIDLLYTDDLAIDLEV